MITNITLKPNQITKQTRIMVAADGYLPYTGAYVGAHTYCINMHTDNSIEFTADNNLLLYNVQIGKYNSIGSNLECVLRNHNYMNVDTGALSLMLQERQAEPDKSDSSFNKKGTIIIQNDVWFGENVTVMGGVIVRNGAVIARNSHVVKDVPPYAVVGGNPAQIIGYRYTKEQIDMLQKISWWDWEEEDIIKNAGYFTEDIGRFCDVFYDDADRIFEDYVSQRIISDDSYFAFVDFYENYSAYSIILKNFIKAFINEKDKKLILFVRSDCEEKPSEGLYRNLEILTEKINNMSDTSCMIEIRSGNLNDAKRAFLNCSHYVVSRTYDTVFFTCLADKLGMEIISGVDSCIQFGGKSKHFQRIR